MKKVFKKKILPNSKYQLEFPILNNTKDKKIFIDELRRLFKPVYLFKIKNIFILNNGIPFFNNREIVFDYLKFNSLSGLKFIKKIILLTLYSFQNLKKKNNCITIKDAIFIADRHSANYYHWVTDVLPKIYMINKKNILKNIPIIIPNFKTSFQRDSIKMITKNIIIIKKNINLNNCYYLSELHNSGCPRPEYIKGIKKLFTKNINKKRYYKNIYISRRYGNYRKILQEKKLIKFLRKENFKIIDAEKLSFIDQIRYFENAKFVISSHGAGLTNLIWMKPKSKILEIRSFNPTQNSNYALCNIFKIKYFYHLVRQVNYSSNGSYLFKLDEFKKYYNEIKNY